MRIYSYIVTTDTGFAPNPFHGSLTLACCKPQIRRTAQIGDWVVGLSRGGARVVYAMRVAEKMSFMQYWADARFEAKKPDRHSTSASARRGDNIYKPKQRAGTFSQLPSSHSHRDGTENPKTKKRDLGGVNVLLANEFVYFGGGGPDVRPKLAFLIVGRGHRCRLPQDEVETFRRWISRKQRGIRGHPAGWPERDDSWREAL